MSVMTVQSTLGVAGRPSGFPGNPRPHPHPPGGRFTPAGVKIGALGSEKNVTVLAEFLRLTAKIDPKSPIYFCPVRSVFDPRFEFILGSRPLSTFRPRSPPRHAPPTCRLDHPQLERTLSALRPPRHHPRRSQNRRRSPRHPPPAPQHRLHRRRSTHSHGPFPNCGRELAHLSGEHLINQQHPRHRLRLFLRTPRQPDLRRHRCCCRGLRQALRHRSHPHGPCDRSHGRQRPSKPPMATGFYYLALQTALRTLGFGLWSHRPPKSKRADRNLRPALTPKS